jgi:hypothetical protein
MAVLVTLALSAAGCATSIADMPLVGVPANTPARPKEVGAYPAVHDLPADREQSAMDPTEQSKIEKELIAARDRQASMGPNEQAAALPKAKVAAAPKAKAHRPTEPKLQQ